MAASRETGLDVLADTTPFREGLGQMAGILPPWLAEDGRRPRREAARPGASRADAQRERPLLALHPQGRVAARRLQGRPAPRARRANFPQIAERLGKDPWDCYLDILADAGTD